MTATPLPRPAQPKLFSRSLEALFAILLLAGVAGVAPGVADLAPALAPREAAAACTDTALSRAPNMNGYFTRQSVTSGTPTKATGAFNGSSTGYFWISGIITRGWAGFSTYTGSSPNTPGTGTTSNCNNYFKYTGFRVGNNGEWGLLVNLRYSNNAGFGAQLEGNEYNHHNTTTTLDNAYSGKSTFTILEGNYTAAQQSLYHSPCTTIYTTQAALDRVKAATVTAPGANCEAIATDSLSLQAAFIYDVTAPSLSVAAADATTNSSAVVFTLTDANHNGLSDLLASSITADDFSITNGTFDSVVCSVDSCDVTVTATAEGTVTLDKAASPSITDAATNAATTFSSASATYDATAPAGASFTLQAASDTGSSDADLLTNAATLVYDLTFSEAVTGLAAGDLSNAGTAASCSFAVAGSDATYTVTVTGCGAGTVTPTIAQDAVIDAAGNTGPTATYAAATTTIDRTAASVTSFAATTASPTTSASVTYDITFSEPITGLATGDFTIGGTANGWSVTDVSGSGSSYTITLTGGGTGTISLAIDLNTITDAAGNVGPASQSGAAAYGSAGPAAPGTISATVDLVAPTVTSFTSNAAGPISSTSTSYTLVFSESVTGLAAGDLTIGGSSTGWTVSSISGSGTTYTITLGNAAPGSGSLTLALGSGTVTDLAGNSGPASSADATSVTIDRDLPAVSSFSYTGTLGPIVTDELQWTLIFTESVTGLSLADLTTGGTATGWTYELTGSGTTYYISARNGTAGSITLALDANTVTDGPGNVGPAESVAASSTIWITDQPVVSDDADTDASVNEVSITITAGDFDFSAGAPGDLMAAMTSFVVLSNNDLGYSVTLVLSDLEKVGSRTGDVVPASIISLSKTVTIVASQGNNGVNEAQAYGADGDLATADLLASSGIRTLVTGDVYDVHLGFTLPWVEDGAYSGIATFEVSSL